MHTLRLKDFIDTHHFYDHLEKLRLKSLKGFHGQLVTLHGLLEKFHVKTLERAFQRASFSDILVMISLFLMVLFIIKTYLRMLF